jgi:hypothetical protein
MNRRIFSLLLVLAASCFVGCSPASKLIGTWDMELPEAEGGTSIMGARIPSALADAMKPKLNIEFQQGGKCRVEAYMGGQSAKAKGTWKFVKAEKDVLVLKVTMEKGGEQEMRVRFIDNNKIEAAPPPLGDEEDADAFSGQTLTFARRPF